MLEQTIYLEMDLRDLDWVSGGALSAHGSEGCRAVGWVCDVVDVVGGVEVLAVPAAEGCELAWVGNTKVVDALTWGR